jgi:hypothetical protein
MLTEVVSRFMILHDVFAKIATLCGIQYTTKESRNLYEYDNISTRFVISFFNGSPHQMIIEKFMNELAEKKIFIRDGRAESVVKLLGDFVANYESRKTYKVNGTSKKVGTTIVKYIISCAEMDIVVEIDMSVEKKLGTNGTLDERCTMLLGLYLGTLVPHSKNTITLSLNSSQFWMIPKSVAKGLHCIIDLFASPINNISPKFCSMNPQWDAPFGSIGSAQDFNPVKFNTIMPIPKIGVNGFIFINPPYIEDVMEFAVKEAEWLMTYDPHKRAIMITLPDWTDSPANVNAMKSKWLRCQIGMDKHKHYYETGNGKTIVAKFRSRVFLMYHEDNPALVELFKSVITNHFIMKS